MSASSYHTSQENVVAMGTNRYDMFRFDPQNRPIDQNHLRKLYDAISTRNLLREFPILVDDSLTIIDGQHRLKAAEALGVPVYYIVSQRITMDDIVSTTDNVSKWQASDYLHRWCMAGKTEYINLRSFYDRYRMHDGNRFLLLTHCMDLCHYGDRTAMHVDFRNGRYMCNDLPFAERVVFALLDFSKYISFYRDTIFIHTISNLMSNADYDHERMMMKMAYLSSRLVKCADTSSYIGIFNQLYNYKVPLQNHVVLRKLTSNEEKYRADKKNRKSAK